VQEGSEIGSSFGEKDFGELSVIHRLGLHPVCGDEDMAAKLPQPLRPAKPRR